MMILEIVILLMVCISLAFNIIVLKDISEEMCNIKTELRWLYDKLSGYTYDDSIIVSNICDKLDDIIAKIDSQENTKKEDPTKESNVIRFVPERLDCNEINSVVTIPYRALEHVSEWDVKKALLDDIAIQISNYISLECASNPTMEEVLYRGKIRILGQPVDKYDPYIFKDLKKED